MKVNIINICFRYIVARFNWLTVVCIIVIITMSSLFSVALSRKLLIYWPFIIRKDSIRAPKRYAHIVKYESPVTNEHFSMHKRAKQNKTKKNYDSLLESHENQIELSSLYVASL